MPLWPLRSLIFSVQSYIIFRMTLRSCYQWAKLSIIVKFILIKKYRLIVVFSSKNCFNFINVFLHCICSLTKLGTKHILVKGIHCLKMKCTVLFKGEIIMKKRKYIPEQQGQFQPNLAQNIRG